MGYFYKFEFFGETIKINNCFIARAFIAIVGMAIILHIIYLTQTHVPFKHKPGVHKNSPLKQEKQVDEMKEENN